MSKNTSTKKSALAKRKAVPNNKYWRKKADDLFMAQFRGEPCEYCGTVQGTAGHHVIAKSVSKLLRYEKMNIVVLCPAHHTFGNDVCAHSMNYLAVKRWSDWFKSNKPLQYKWIKKHEKDKTKPLTYKKSFEQLKETL